MTMTAEDWDVEKYKVEHECDEHWELRKNFLEAHREKFPEEQLVCLAQVFTNVELLGCRYVSWKFLTSLFTQNLGTQWPQKYLHNLNKIFHIKCAKFS